jgi:hypothetical protein
VGDDMMAPITLRALVRNKATGRKGIITKDKYTSKEQFWRVLERHNYIVIRISNNRDLAAQEYGFDTFSAMKKHDKHFRETTKKDSAFTKIIDDISRLPL